MLEHLGEVEAANAIVEGIKKTTASGLKTKDLGGDAKTDEVANQIIKNIDA